MDPHRCEEVLSFFYFGPYDLYILSIFMIINWLMFLPLIAIIWIRFYYMYFTNDVDILIT